ncbi:S-adenosyl-L-methionine-dependent methyltransferase [Aspergillus bertholletiae]|uniref:S-adenosyl-L-methionine-dependent methyltransferase n=1 Tax=Aspergillus bertholletiae TaxID=1226010 RepID=A0A5N7B9W3_9EURO|nr:S-adenosyl-L-methionine-dependent methyltransferase [Aspergillus bertholletiae]
MDPLQYNGIGHRLNDMNTLPGVWILHDILAKRIGTVCGLSVLDLACGTGDFSRQVIDWGAKRVVGVDISEAMVENARLQAREGDPSEFHIVDCSRPFNMGKFDLTLGKWLLNYAANKTELMTMWQNIFHSLKPGGQFVGVIPNPRILQTVAQGQRYHYEGIIYKILEQVTDRTRIQVTLNIADPVTFYCYIHEPRLHEDCATQAGFSNLKWEPLPREYNVKLSLPFFQIITASCPESQTQVNRT